MRKNLLILSIVGGILFLAVLVSIHYYLMTHFPSKISVYKTALSFYTENTITNLIIAYFVGVAACYAGALSAALWNSGHDAMNAKDITFIIGGFVAGYRTWLIIEDFSLPIAVALTFLIALIFWGIVSFFKK